MHRPTFATRMRTWSSTALVGAATIALLAGCQTTLPDDSTAGPTAGGTLHYASGDGEPSCLDPHVGGNYPQALLATQYLDSLVSLSQSGEIIPWLAESWQVSDDALTWDFTLRDDVNFTDGTPFDAEAVKVNVEHVKDPATQSSTGYLALAKVDSVEVVSPTQVRFHLSVPDSALLESLSQPWLAIESPAGLVRGMVENCQAPIGTGPFIVESWTPQDSISLVRNDAYNSPPADASHDGPAYLDGIEWRFLPDSASRYAALQAGEVDVIDNAQPDTIAQAESNPALVELEAPRPGASNRLELNSGHTPFDDERVREAFVRAVSVNDGIDSLFFGTAERSYSVLSSVESLAYSEPDLFNTDLDAANNLLDAAGWTERDDDETRMKDGRRLTVRFPISTNQSIPAEQSLFEQVQATAKDAGFDVVLTPLDLSGWYDALAANEYEIVSAPYTKVGPDVLRILYHSDSITPAPSGYFANLSQLDDPALDALLTAAASESGGAERAALYEQVQQIILGGFYALPLYDQQNHFLMNADLRGVRSMPTVSTPTFVDAWFAD